MSSTIASSAPPSPSLKSLNTSRAWSPYDATELEAPISQTNESKDLLEKHLMYYFKDGNLIFLVDHKFYSLRHQSDTLFPQIEGKLYNIHRYFFERDSSYFRSVLKGPAGADINNPLVLPGLNCCDFDEFLAILYPT